MNLLTLEGLSFTYPGLRGAPASFSLNLSRLSVDRGERLLLTGPSGCGKSTLLNLIAGALKPDSGTLVVSGLDMVSASEARRRAHRIQSMGFVFQDYPLVSHLTALENVLLPYRINPALRLDSTSRQRGQSLLSQLDLGKKASRRPAALSQGERQRVAIARALVTQPALLLADEPTAGLDPERASAVMELLDELVAEKGLTLIMVSHDVAMQSRFTRILDMGRLS